MKFSRTILLILGSALLLMACSKDADQASVAVKQNTNPLLAHVPADTAYVYADLEQVPEAVTDAYVTRFQPALDVLTKKIDEFQAKYQAGDHEGKQAARLASAVLDELGGSLNEESLNRIGISTRAHYAFYAEGVFPVVRLALSDAEALRGAIGRIEARMGYQLPTAELGGAKYWRIAEDGSPVGIYIAIEDGQLALSVFPVGAEASLLPSFLGQEMPAQSLASNNALAVMNQARGYAGYGSGYMDIRKIANEILDPGSETRAMLGDELNAEMDALDAVCIDELKSIVARTPRMTGGITRLTANEMAMRYDLEIENSLAAGLAALVSDIPAATPGDYLLSASLAIRVGKLREFVLEKATALAANPYQCEKLQNVNDEAEKLVSQLNIPMPPMVNNLLGLRIMINDYDPSKSLTRGDGLLAVHVDKPEMFVGMASMIVPGFEGLDLPNQKEPVRIPPDMTHLEDMDVFALMTRDAIGVAVGEQHLDELKPFMNAAPQSKGTLLSVSNNLAKQMEMEAALSRQFNFDADLEDASALEFSEAVKKVYKDTLGQSRVDVRLTADGLHIDSSITFK